MTLKKLGTRRDGWTAERRAEFIGALRVTGRVADACAWVGMSVTGAYALAKRDGGFASAWDATLAARALDRQPRLVTPAAALGDAALIRQMRRADTRQRARPRGIVAQQNMRWA